MPLPIEVILATLRHAKLDTTLIATDFDGTLSAIVDDPAAARAGPEAMQALAELSQLGVRIAVVSGRTVTTLLELADWSGIDNLTISGLHGAQTWRSGPGLTTLDEPPGLAAVRSQLPALLTADPGVWLEDKGLSVVVHTRRARDPQSQLEKLREPVTTLARRHGLDVVAGKLVWEIRIPDLSKADALSALLTDDIGAALFAGDDVGDLPAMQTLARWRDRTGRAGVSIAVGAEPAVRRQADLQVDSPAAFAALLAQLCHELRSDRG